MPAIKPTSLLGILQPLGFKSLTQFEMHTTWTHSAASNWMGISKNPEHKDCEKMKRRLNDVIFAAVASLERKNKSTRAKTKSKKRGKL